MSAEARQSRKLSRQEREEFLALPHIGVLSVAAEDGRPPSTLPTWYAYEPGGNIAVVARGGKRKSRLIRQAGLLSFCVQRAERPYEYVTVEGAVVAQRPPSREELTGIGRRYIDPADVDAWADWELSGGNGNGEPEYIEIRPDRWLTAKFPPPDA
ncbi:MULTISPECIES: pyridoxamine 5'-phosphate oxidase family protein [unclassified Streptomyces]|uniref:pyridoxamine 5'-phosphate oxidase family protein n=1 Tax=unclassified Streptomyces TaxID=2593676 RepID=UPI0036E5E2FA